VATVSKVFSNTYRDSVLLMRIASKIREKEGIKNAEIIMATPINKKVLSNVGINTDNFDQAGPNDLLIVVLAEDKEAAVEALEVAEKMVLEGNSGDTRISAAKSIGGALAQLPDANLAIISVPGEYVRDVALKTLKKGLNLLIFSDNVSSEVELELKQFAEEKGLLVMGPDCGTANINGLALAFANKVRIGTIGLVGASGTGLQAVSTLLHQHGLGISNAIGTGSNDVTDTIGGLTMLKGIDLLENDPATEVIVIISKPPGSATREKIIDRLKKCHKPVVINFLGYQGQDGENLEYANTLEETAHKAAEVIMPTGKKAKEFFQVSERLMNGAKAKQSELLEGQKYVRGLFAGGTMAIEAGVIMREITGHLHGNIKLDGVALLQDPYKSKENTIIDLGSDEFTVGRPHPMIDSTLRGERLIAEAADPGVAVILMDFILGYGSSPDPAGEMINYIKKASDLAKEDGRSLIFVASICGTDQDPQDIKAQIDKLEKLGVMVLPSNDRATNAAMIIATRS